MNALLSPRCGLCGQPSVAGLEFEGGDDANYTMTLEVCEAHFQEHEADEWAFRDKYAERIDEGCYEELIDAADGLHDRMRDEGGL